MSETAIRDPMHAQAHREISAADKASRMYADDVTAAVCGWWSFDFPPVVTVPLDQVPPEDWCRRCWPKEQR